MLHDAFFKWSQQYHGKTEADLGSMFEGASEAGRSTVDDLAAESENNSVHSTKIFGTREEYQPTPKKVLPSSVDETEPAPTPKIRKKVRK